VVWKYVGYAPWGASALHLDQAPCLVLILWDPLRNTPVYKSHVLLDIALVLKYNLECLPGSNTATADQNSANIVTDVR
jgi:hypothetical protein